MTKNAFSTLKESIGKLKSQALPDLVGSLGAKLPVDEIAQSKSHRTRNFTLTRTFWLFLYQVLEGNLSLDIIVQIAKAWFLEMDNVSISSNTSAYSQARLRFPTPILRKIDQHIQDQFTPPPGFHGFHVKLVDGTGISVPDTPENRQNYHLHPKAGKCSGFPAFKLVGLFDHRTGVNLEWGMEDITTSDSAVYRLFWPHLKPNDLVVGDRHFCGFAYFVFLLKRGVQSMTRKHQTRKYQETVKRLGENDLIVKWKKPKDFPKWLSQEEWDTFPDSLQVREITYNVQPKGFRTKSISIDTTVLDETISAGEWAELYFHRWKIELNLRDIKITMGMDMLKGKTPAIIEKEIFMYFIAYNLIRLLMSEAAEKNGVDLGKISFKSTITAIRVWGPILGRTLENEQYERLFDEFLKMIAYPRCRNRKNRSEPRARKRRPKNYQLLTGDRHEFKEIAHRSKYKKAA